MLDDQSVRSEDGDVEGNFVFERRPRLKRKRVVLVFDQAYLAHGMAVYSAATLLIHQLGVPPGTMYSAWTLMLDQNSAERREFRSRGPTVG